MGSFLLLLPAQGREADARRLFKRGIQVARNLKKVDASGVAECDWFLAASFPRQNGSGGALVQDPSTGAMLLSVGTWFHEQGMASGDERALLQRCLAVEPRQLADTLQGFFVIVVADASKREAVVITDVVGSCHCYIRRLPEGIAVSSSPVLLAVLAPWELDHVACQEFLQTGIIYEDRTFFREVRKLTPASIHRVSGSGATEQRYWSAAQLAPESLPDDVAVQSLWDSLTSSARKIAQRFPRPICDLTGGYDSRALVAAFSGAGVPFATTVSGPADSADVMISRQLAAAAGLPHFPMQSEMACSAEDVREAFRFTDGEYDSVEYARVLSLHKRMAQQFDISVNGSYGELARGYWWELLFPFTGKTTEIDYSHISQKRYAAPDPPSLYSPQLRISLPEHMAEVIQRTNTGLQRFPNTFQLDHAYISMRMRCWQGSIAHSTDQLWPCISPFMFRSSLEIMLQAKPSLRTRSLMIRKMLAVHHSIFANARLELGYPALPVRWNNFPRFWRIVPYYGSKVVDRLFPTTPPPPPRSPLQCDPEVQEILDPSEMLLAPALDEQALRNFLSRCQETNAAGIAQWRQLFTLELTLQNVSSATRELASSGITN